MKKFDFIVSVVADDLDRAATVMQISSCLNENLPEDAHGSVKAGHVKSFSEQGFKVWRARVTGVTVAQAGDAHNPKATADA